MSEDGFDDSDYFEWYEEEGEGASANEPLNSAPSPVLLSTPLAYETAEIDTDWERSADEFFDDQHAEHQRRRRRKRGKFNGGRKESPAKDMHPAGTDDRPVMWLSVHESTSIVTSISMQDGHSPASGWSNANSAKPIAILKDWRTYFGSKASLPSTNSVAKKRKAPISSPTTSPPAKPAPQASKRARAQLRKPKQAAAAAAAAATVPTTRRSTRASTRSAADAASQS